MLSERMKKNLKILSENGRVYNKFSALVDINDEIQSLSDSERDSTFDSLDLNVKEALDKYTDAWKYTPNENVEWSGIRGFSNCVLSREHPNYEACKNVGMTMCLYFNNEPIFEGVTVNGSEVVVSDLYDIFSTKDLDERGSGKQTGESFHDIAQDRMRFRPEVIMQMKRWWEEKYSGEVFVNNRETFFAWRDAYDLVPHEDANCYKMRLIPRVVHNTFVHQGGIANANNIKEHFNC